MFNFNTKPFHVAAGAYVKKLLLWQQAADNKPKMNQFSQGIGLYAGNYTILSQNLTQNVFYLQQWFCYLIFYNF